MKLTLALIILLGISMESYALVSSPVSRYCALKIKRFNEVLKEGRAYDSSGKVKEDWAIDGANEQFYPPYNRTFSQALNGLSLEDFAASKATSHTLDLFGSAIFSPKPSAFSTLTGVRIGDLAESRYPKDFDYSKWRELKGDLYKSSIWRNIDESMKERGIPAYDLVLIRPEGPVTDQLNSFVRRGEKEPFLNANYHLLNRIWNRLSVEGTLLVQIHDEMLSSLDGWVKKLNAANVEATIHESDRHFKVLKIVKKDSSPPSLPRGH